MTNQERCDIIYNYYRELKQAHNESVKKEKLISLLTLLFAGHDEFNLLSQFTDGAEKSLNAIYREGKKSSHGRADTQYGSILIEFENNLKKTGQHAEEQLCEYLSANWNSGTQIQFTLIATDCLIWKIYTLDYKSLTNLGLIRAEDIQLQYVETFILTPDKADEFYYFLDRFLFHSEPLPATLEEIRKTFGARSEIFQASLNLLHRYFTTIRTSSEIQTAYEQWHKFLSIAYGQFNASEEIFLIHSYLSILAKIIVYQVLTDCDFIEDSELLQILSGEAFRQRHIANFTDEDFFRWTALAGSSSEIKQVARTIAQGLERFDFNHVNEDILKGVYQELIDDDTKHSLGEYYTPDWLCTAIIQELKPQKGQKILDPSCGSGSFLKAAITYLIKNHPDISAEEINDSIYGIDVHPLSVQITKATVLIALGKKLLSVKTHLSLNIFLANTLLLPDKEIDLFGNLYRLTIDNEKIDLPESIIQNRQQFYQIIDLCNALSEHSRKNKLLYDFKQFHKIFMSKFNISDLHILQYLYNLYIIFAKLKINNRDGIWAFILTNNYSPFFLQNYFHYIIGNPPWISFKYFQNVLYQNALENIAKRYFVKPQETNLMATMEIAIIFLVYCLNYFLQDNGTLAFVLPRSIFSGQQHSKLRLGKTKGVVITKVWDLQNIFPLFNVPSCVLFSTFTSNNIQFTKEIPVKILSGNLKQHNLPWEQAQDHLSITEDFIYLSHLGHINAWNIGTKINYNGQNFYRNKFKNGASLIPRRFFFVDIDQEYDGNLDDRLLHVISSDTILQDAKVPWKDVKMSGFIHTSFLYETALANNIVPFALNGTNLLLLPLIIDHDKKIHLSTLDEILESGHIETYEYFCEVVKIWENKKSERSKNISIFDYINWMNKLTTQNLSYRYIVLYTASGSNTVSTLIDRQKSTQLHFITESTTFAYFTNNYNEANYLMSFFNSKYTNRLIKPFQSRGSYGTRHIATKILEIPWPCFDTNNPKHHKLAEIAEQAGQIAKQFIASKNFDAKGNSLNAIKLGQFRNEVREVLKSQLAEIDDLVLKILE